MYKYKKSQKFPKEVGMMIPKYTQTGYSMDDDKYKGIPTSFFFY